MKKIILANPRGFCAGVERAIHIVEIALEKYGSPIYVRHEIVHNKAVVDSLKVKGVIFVNEIEEVPENSIVIFSAHGVSLDVEIQAKNINLSVIDATCPLVKKVHHQVQRYEKKDRTIILIGHHNHPEIEGTKGRINGQVYLVENIDDIHRLNLDSDTQISYATQTTLSIDDTLEMIKALHSKFTNVEGPELSDICYATQNRQKAVKDLAKEVDTIFVIGSKNSSNSNRLRDIAEEYCVHSYLINDYRDIELSSIGENVGITAGASAPEHLITDVITFLIKHYPKAEIINMEGVKESVKFRLPYGLE